MKIISTIIEKCKSFFKKKEKVLTLDVAKESEKDKREYFLKTLQIIEEKRSEKKKKVETHICFGDGLGIYNKIEF